MAKLNLIRTANDLLEYRASVWENEVGEGRVPGINAYIKLPCLVRAVPNRYAFNLGAVGLFTAACSKSEAKRIIYPKTNKNRCKLSGFVIIEGGNLKDLMKAYITSVIERIKTTRNINVDTTHPVQSRMIDRAISDLDGIKGSALIHYKTYINLDRFRLTNFYTVDEADARKLVYCGKKPKRDAEFKKFVLEYNKSFYGE